MSHSRPTTMKKYINVNTKFRPYVKGVQPKNTDFLVTLPNPIRNVLSMKLKSFNAPNAEYTFSVDELIKILRSKKLIRGKFVSFALDKVTNDIYVGMMIQQKVDE